MLIRFGAIPLRPTRKIPALIKRKAWVHFEKPGYVFREDIKFNRHNESVIVTIATANNKDLISSARTINKTLYLNHQDRSPAVLGLEK